METELNYTLTAESLKTGLKHFTKHRAPIRRFLLPTIGIFILLVGISSIIKNNQLDTFSLILIILGTFYLYLPKINIARSLKTTLKGKTCPMPITMKTSKESLSCITPDANSTLKWESFVDSKIILEKGLLIFPQKNLHFWIPADANFTTGDWKTFTKTVTSKIKRKI